MAKMKDNELVLTGKALDEMYGKYLSSYGNKAKELRKNYGIGMWDTKYTKQEFQVMYSAQARTLMIEKGWNKISDKVVIRSLVERQSTELTEKQAKAFQKGMKEQYGEYYSMKDIYTTAPEKIKELYDRMERDGITDTYEKKAIISSAFFGSPS